MVPDRQKVRTDGMDGRTDGRTDDAKTISLRLRRGIIIQKAITSDKSLINGNDINMKLHVHHPTMVIHIQYIS